VLLPQAVRACEVELHSYIMADSKQRRRAATAPPPAAAQQQAPLAAPAKTLCLQLTQRFPRLWQQLVTPIGRQDSHANASLTAQMRLSSSCSSWMRYQQIKIPNVLHSPSQTPSSSAA
jgi:hypothetical protein